MFPTNKEHISYSEVRNWKECSYRHKLQQIDKIDMSQPSPFLDFGTNVHEGCEYFLKGAEIPKQDLLNNIKEAWATHGFDNKDWVDKQPGWYKYEPLETWLQWAESMWNDIPSFLDETFPGWSPVEAEEELYEPIPSRPVKFKGFIDAIIKVPKKRGNGFKYWIIDWKTSGPHGWRTSKKRDPLTQYQLVLYKNFWSKKHGIDPKDVSCGFVLLKRGGKPGKMCSLVEVSAGPVITERANKLLSNMISSVQRGMFLKNRNNCSFCEYANTEHCV